MISSDVNVFFAYGDIMHPRHKEVSLFILKNLRKPFILLNRVKTSFLYTYSDYLKECSRIVSYGVAQNRGGARSPIAVSAIIRKDIENRLQQLSRETNFMYLTTKRFVDRMLEEFPIPKLLQDDALSEFRERFLEKAEEEAVRVLNLMFTRFIKRHLMSLADYRRYDEWLSRLKLYGVPVFANMQDHEDLQIGAELFSYWSEHGRLNFHTLDKEMRRSILLVKRREGLVGNAYAV
jgi:hypothetical protein